MSDGINDVLNLARGIVLAPIPSHFNLTTKTQTEYEYQGMGNLDF